MMRSGLSSCIFGTGVQDDCTFLLSFRVNLPLSGPNICLLACTVLRKMGFLKIVKHLLGRALSSRSGPTSYF